MVNLIVSVVFHYLMTKILFMADTRSIVDTQFVFKPNFYSYDWPLDRNGCQTRYILITCTAVIHYPIPTQNRYNLIVLYKKIGATSSIRALVHMILLAVLRKVLLTLFRFLFWLVMKVFGFILLLDWS